MKAYMKFGVALATLLTVSSLQALSLADASAKIDAAIENPAVMTSTVKELSPSDQVAFLARVNAAIDALPGSPAEKAANYLKVNSAALKGAAKGNFAALLAEIFATVPPEALTIINERFASDLFNRSANPSRPISDNQMAAIALTTTEKIRARLVGVDNAAVREIFVMLMFLRASGGTPADLQDQMLAQCKDPAVREMAKSDWIPAAMGKGQPKSYEPMLGASDAGEQPDVQMTIQIAGAQTTLALLANLNDMDAKTPVMSAAFATSFNMIPDALDMNVGLNRVVHSDDPRDPWYTGGKREELDEPGGYGFQTIGGQTK